MRTVNMDKPRWTEVTDKAEVMALFASNECGGLESPWLYQQIMTGKFFADADELRLWRSQNTSAGQPK